MLDLLASSRDDTIDKIHSFREQISELSKQLDISHFSNHERPTLVERDTITNTQLKQTKCSGSKEKCELPSGNSHSTAITVGVAVAIPVAFVIIILGTILYIVRKRSKKEEREDDDPDFFGDTEYLPSQLDHHNDIMIHDNSYSMDQFNNNNNFSKTNLLPNSMSNSQNGLMEKNNSMMDNPFNNDPFQLPNGNNDSIRDFARQLQDDGIGGYRYASQSRNASQLSLRNHINKNNTNNVNGYMDRNPNRPNNLQNVIQRHPNMESEQYDNVKSQQKMNHNHKKDIENNKIDDNNGIDFNQKNQTVNQTEKVEFDDKTYNDNNFASDLSPEEENIQRMKSIYKVYLDRSETLRNDRGLSNEIQLDNMPVDGDAELSRHVNNENNSNNNENNDNNNHLNTSNNLDVKDNEKSRRIASSIYSESATQMFQNGGYNYNNNNNYVNNDDMASSIYTSQTNGNNYRYNDNNNNMVQQYQNPQQEYYNPQQQQQQMQMQNSFPPLPNLPSHNTHPQTLEQIDELPMPSKLMHSQSSHSLTSFKKQIPHINKQLPIQQTQRFNGTALNPMDHPDLFYTSNNNEFQPHQLPIANSNGSIMSNSTNVPNIVSPHQLRKSIVMTNPAELQNNKTYKPAGSLRNMNGVNNTPMTNMPYGNNNGINSYSMGNVSVINDATNKIIHNRVSGILHDTDMVQPQSIGGILPHSGSNDDLRKQLGVSTNYTVV